MPSSLRMRCISIERFSTPETGLLISCATLAESCPSEASRSLCISFFCAALSWSVLSCDLRLSRLWVNVLISSGRLPEPLPHDVEGAASSSSSSDARMFADRPVEVHGSLMAFVPSMSRLIGRPTKRRVNQTMNDTSDARGSEGDQHRRCTPDRRSAGPPAPGRASESRTPRTFCVAGWAWHAASLQDGSL